MLTLALSKGRLLQEALPLLDAIGCTPAENPASSRTLIIPTAHPQVRLVVVRAQDAPTYVACGAADAGITGGDVVAENPNGNLYQPVTLPIGGCRLVVAHRADAPPAAGQQLTVATKYTNLTRAYFNAQGMHVHIIKLYGSVELAPLTDMADIIVDLASSGNTLRANGLVEAATIREVSGVFITNRVAARRKPLLAEMQQRLQAACDDAK